MPVCNNCKKMQATAEMRRSPKSGWVCKDKVLCNQRRKKL